MNKKDYYWAKYMLIFGFFCICFGTSIFLKTEHAPDEAMRMLIPEYIVSHHALPNGIEEAVRHPLWGFSYALYPYLTALISAVFMGIAALFNGSAAVLLTAARLTSVLSGTGTLIVVFLIGEELFERRESALLGGIFVGFLPQFVFLSCYVNNDSFAVFTVALIIYFWIRGMKNAFCKKDCIGLGAGCGLCALSYYNAYAYLLCSILLFFALMIHFRKPAKEIFAKALLVFAIAFLIGGWFFAMPSSTTETCSACAPQRNPHRCMPLRSTNRKTGRHRHPKAGALSRRIYRPRRDAPPTGCSPPSAASSARSPI